MLVEEAKLKGLPECKRDVVLLFDEMKLSESLVYDKQSAQVNAVMTYIHQSLPHMLGLMVHGVFSNLHFPYAHFATSDKFSGENLFLIMWEAIERLERLGFKVVALTGDGASQNRKFLKMHAKPDDELCYKTNNPYTDEDRYIYFVSDVPHLLKTTRNCWSHSFGYGKTRKMWVSKYMADYNYCVFITVYM